MAVTEEVGEAGSRVEVEDSSQVGEARRIAVALAERVGFDQTGRGRVGIVVTEAANNLVQHGGGGEIILTPTGPAGHRGLAVLALDKGRGMADPAQCLRDGYSTAGTPGTGLGAIRRQSDLFDLYSAPGQGTALLAHLLVRPARRSSRRPKLELGVVCLAKRGEEVSGDAWAAEPRSDGGLRLMVSDGLGHGSGAAQASLQAVRIFRETTRYGLEEVLSRAHGALRSTRGAAVAVADVLPSEGAVRYAGVGNIVGMIWADGTTRNMMSHNGTVGLEARKIHELSYPLADGAVVVLHSDGLRTTASLDRYPGLAAHSPGLVAGVLYRDHDRGRDDVAVVVVRVGGADPGWTTATQAG